MLEGIDETGAGKYRIDNASGNEGRMKADDECLGYRAVKALNLLGGVDVSG